MPAAEDRGLSGTPIPPARSVMHFPGSGGVQSTHTVSCHRSVPLNSSRRSSASTLGLLPPTGQPERRPHGAARRLGLDLVACARRATVPHQTSRNPEGWLPTRVRSLAFRGVRGPCVGDWQQMPRSSTSEPRHVCPTCPASSQLPLVHTPRRVNPYRAFGEASQVGPFPFRGALRGFHLPSDCRVPRPSAPRHLTGAWAVSNRRVMDSQGER
jgi:hypothetical protein